VLLFLHAKKRELFRVPMPPAVYRWGLIASASPVVLFLISVPAAFVNSYFAVVFWFLNFPFQIMLNRWQPDLAQEYWG
jgi:hypothetical protein